MRWRLRVDIVVMMVMVVMLVMLVVDGGVERERRERGERERRTSEGDGRRLGILALSQLYRDGGLGETTPRERRNKH